jgi:dephospho-CoA kinase
MDNIVIAFAGPIGSGKSTLSGLVSNTLGWPSASFGTYVRKSAEVYGFDKTRKGLQLTGNFLISRGWKVFCEEVLADANWKPGSNLVVEGIRHLEALETLRDIVTPANIYLIYVSLDEAERKTRLKARNHDNRLNLEELELHPTEEQVKTILFNQADLVVENNRPRGKVASEIIAWIRSLLAVKE